ncbi:MAG: hypothetical protein U0P46_05265 [Holophagaceae bacterium]
MAMIAFRLANPLLAITLGVLATGCGRKGDPIPRPRAAAQAMEVQLEGLRRIRLVLPSEDVKGGPLVGVEVVRVIYLPMGLTKPTPEEVFSRGEVVLERRRPDLPGPGSPLLMDLRSLQRPQGWIVVVAVRVGDVPGRPSEVLPWLDPAL